MTTSPRRVAGVRRTTATALAAGVLAAAVASCSTGGDTTSATSGTEGSTVTLVTHDSFSMPEEVLATFEERTGHQLEVVPSGDAGEVTNKLVLTKENPIGDVVFGIDNTFASRAVDEGVLREYTPEEQPASADRVELDDPDGAAALTPVDWGDVCVNIDDAWFAEHDLAPPRTLDDLVDPAYRGLLVVPSAATSSPGFAFLLATIGHYGPGGWQDYWRQLVDNDVRVVSGWSDAYEVDFTGGGGGGDRPIVVSYNSSPPFTIPEGGDRPTTSALLDTCFRQVEYAGVLAGTDNVEGAQALVDFMVSRTFQDALAENMYVFPVDAEAQLPELWRKWAQPARDPIEVSSLDVDRRRTEWVREWSDLVAQ